jgi:hypothetical protein
MENSMIITLVWDGHPIPNLPATGTRDAIYALDLPKEDAENLWALWCALDALIDETFIGLRAGLGPIQAIEIFGLLVDPQFMDTLMGESDKCNGYDWSRLPAWIEANKDKITTTQLS